MVSLNSYPGYLNVVLFECSPDDMHEVAQDAQERIEHIQRTRVEDRAILWLPELEATPRPTPDDGHNTRFYRPRIYTTTGTFDVAALFLSPKMELSPWIYPKALRNTGQDIHMCLLPRGSCFGCGGEKDFNRHFCDAYERAATPTGVEKGSLPAEQLFVGIMKLKLNPSVFWPADTRPSQGEEHLAHVLGLIGAQVNDWRAAVRVASEYGTPLAAVGLDAGWSEILVVAHADDPSKILGLLTRLRQIVAPSSFVGNKVSHLVATSITTIGADYRLRHVASQIWVDLARQRRRVAAGELIRLAAEMDAGPAPSPQGRVASCYLQIGSDAYPGHEITLLELFRELRDALAGEGLLAVRDWPGMNYGFEAGKHDIWAPPLVLEHLPPVRAWLLHGLIQLWARSSGVAIEEGGRILSCFDFRTRFGCLENGKEDLRLTSPPPDHIAEYPAWYLRRTEPYASLLQTLDKRLLFDLRSAMALLQVPYALAEQVVNLANTFFWAWNREVLWDESIEILPVLLALKGNLQGYAGWWKKACKPGYEQEPLPLAPHKASIPALRLQEDVGRTLQNLFDRHLPGVLQAFRAYFYNRHLASYLTDGLPDANLRFRGSVQQLLSIVNMVVDTLGSVVLGWRGSMAIIGDTTSPDVSSPCDILLVRLNLGSLSAPILLESIGHEIGHNFVHELAKDATLGEETWRSHPWVQPPRLPASRRASLLRLRTSFKELSEEVFLGELFVARAKKAQQVFIESTADVIEFLVLGYDSIDEWAKSFTLRMALAGYPTTRPVRNEGEEHFTVPYLNEEVISSAVLRCVVVQIALSLAAMDRVPDLRRFKHDLVGRGLEPLRLALRRNCTLGPSQDAPRLLVRRSEKAPGDDERCWERFLETQVFEDLPWLADSMALNRAWRFYRALRAYLAWSPGESSPGSERFLDQVRAAFRDLRTSFLDQFLPALYVRHWMGPEERSEARVNREKLAARDPDPDSRSYFEVPWRVTPQPHVARLHLDESRRARKKDLDIADRGGRQGPDYKSLLFQRGTMLARSNEVQSCWMEIHSRFFLRMMALIPSWRSTTLKKVALVEGARQ